MSTNKKKEFHFNGNRRSVDHANQIMSLKDANLHNNPPSEFEAQDAHKAKAKPRVSR